MNSSIVVDLQLGERVAGQRLDRERDVLQAFRPALRGDDDLFERTRRFRARTAGAGLAARTAATADAIL